jgi:hypothetical protein
MSTAKLHRVALTLVDTVNEHYTKVYDYMETIFHNEP